MAGRNIDQFQVDREIFQTCGNLLFWVIFLTVPFFLSIKSKLKMNTRSRIQALSGAILDYFENGKAPTWKDLSPSFAENNIDKFTGMERLSTDFLKCVFKNSEDIIDKIQFFKDHHHFLVILLLKDEYCLESCSHCGYISRKTGINMEDDLLKSSEWS